MSLGSPGREISPPCRTQGEDLPVKLFTPSDAVHVCCPGVRKKATFSQVPQEKLTLTTEESSKGEIFSAH